MSKFLVTGGAGFIGSALVRGLLAQGADRVAVVDNLLTGHERNLDEVRGSVDFHRVDIRDYDALRKAFEGVEVVFHEAAIPSVPRSIHEPVPSHEVNIDGTFNVLRAAKEAGVRRVIYAASSSAYGDSEVLPKVELMRAPPKSRPMVRGWRPSLPISTPTTRPARRRFRGLNFAIAAGQAARSISPIWTPPAPAIRARSTRVSRRHKARSGCSPNGYAIARGFDGA